MRRLARLPLLAVALLIAGCTHERAFIEALPDPWAVDAARLDSLTAADRLDEALALARQRTRAALSGLEPQWRLVEARARERELAARAIAPPGERAALAAADRDLAEAERLRACDSLAAAEAAGARAYAVRTALCGAHSLASADAAMSLAESDFQLSHVHRADSLARQARATFVAALGAEHPRVADAEDMAGRLVKNYEGALAYERIVPHYEYALRVRTGALGPNATECANNLHELANLERLRYHASTALALLGSALEIRLAHHALPDEEVAATYGGMAFLRATQARWPEAELLISRALATMPPPPAGSTGTRAIRLALRGQALRCMGRDAEALVDLRAAAAIRESVWAHTPRDEGSSVNAGLSVHRDIALALASQGHGDEAFAELERGASRVLLARELGDSALAHDPWRDALARVQRALPEDAALIAWPRTGPLPSIADMQQWACVVRAHGPVRWFHLAGSAARDRAARTSREALWIELKAASEWPLRSPEAAPVERMSQRMWQAWFAPLEPALVGVHRIVVSSSDFLVGGPLGPLEDDHGRTLAERYTISYVPSALVYAYERERSRPAGGMRVRPALLLGDPAYSPRDPHRWSALAGTGDEVRAIARHLPASELLVGAQADAARLRALAGSGAMGRFGLLHLAAHAQADARGALESALVLAPDIAGDSLDSQLSAAEIGATWKLDADLVCLSACRSASGLLSMSDGLLGLQLAFLSAGARSLLVSLWPVEDHATAILMDAFYARLFDAAHPCDRAEALQSAQQTLRAWRAADGTHPYAHPVYWAAFALIGDPG